MGLPVKFALTNSNYLGFKDRNELSSVESWTTVRISKDLPVLKGATISADYGRRQNTEKNDDGDYNTTFSPAFEAKYKQKFTDNFRGYLRYRSYDKTEQLRLSVGANYPVTERTNIYADLHATAKKTWGSNPEEKLTFGIWGGADYKITDNLSIWGEVQVNKDKADDQTCVPHIDNADNQKSFSTAVNCGLTYKF